jgi:hypothetical protein
MEEGMAKVVSQENREYLERHMPGGLMRTLGRVATLQHELDNLEQRL